MVREMKNRGLPFLLLFYFAIVAVLLGLGGFDLTKAVQATASLSNNSAPQQTYVDEQVRSARQIREALAKPLPAIERLPPITAKVANQKTESHPVKEAHKVPNLSKAAREALASADAGGARSVAYANYDRHAPQ